MTEMLIPPVRYSYFETNKTNIINIINDINIINNSGGEKEKREKKKSVRGFAFSLTTKKVSVFFETIIISSSNINK